MKLSADQLGRLNELDEVLEQAHASKKAKEEFERLQNQRDEARESVSSEVDQSISCRILGLPWSRKR